MCVDPEDVEALTGAMRRMCTEGTLRASLATAGLAHAARFRWDDAARRTLAAYERAAAPTC
jgi:glycosyltransferase involved in cell wall biosynthesis